MGENITWLNSDIPLFEVEARISKVIRATNRGGIHEGRPVYIGISENGYLCIEVDLGKGAKTIY